MSNRAEDRDKPAPRRSVVSVTALRVIDACLRVLQRLRNRFEPPDEDEGSSRGSGKRSQSAAEQSPASEECAPRPKGLLFRVLIVLVGLLLAGAAGALISYYGLSKLVEARGAAVERVQEELDIAKKEESRIVNLMSRFQRENGEYRLQVHEAQREVEEYKNRIDELDKQLAATRRVERPAPKGVRGAVPAESAKPRAPQKTGNCAVDTGNLSGGLSDCIDKFNRP
jgi:hypothetical protein